MIDLTPIANIIVMHFVLRNSSPPNVSTTFLQIDMAILNSINEIG